MQRDTRPTYTTLEASAVVGFHPQTVRDAIKDGELKAVGQRPYRISATELSRWWEERGGGTLLLPQMSEDLEELRNPTGIESTVDHARSVAGGLRTLANLGDEHGIDFPDLKGIADKIEAALPESKS